LSAEIVVIILGSVAHTSFTNQVIIVSGLALFFTLAVYGLAAAIVKMDDVGLYLIERAEAGKEPGVKSRVSAWCGRGLVNAAPPLMKTLSVLGTLAMFLVGGGILAHGWPWLQQGFEALNLWWLQLANMAVGLVAGAIVLAVMTLVRTLRPAS